MSELIDRQALLDECLNHYEVGNIEQNCTMDWICKTVRNFPTESPWHRVEEGLPPNAKHPGAFCKKYQVMTKWGVTEGWFNPDVGENGLWDILVWFFMGHYDDVNDIDFERGDKPKLMWVTKDYVSAWREMPEPPQSDER